MHAPKTYDDIDWTMLRANAMAQKGWKSKGPKEWDEKAQSFSARTRHHGYVELFLSHLPLNTGHTVLDIGSGPGTLALPVAAKVKSVTAIDFSEGMLQTLRKIAKENEIDNIDTIQCAWEDDWGAKGIQPHDIAIASRSMGVRDLQTALKKIDSFATEFVFISDRIGPTPFEAAAFAAVGRSFQPGPDYIYTLNMLYKLGIHPNVTVLEIDPLVHYSSLEKALDAFTWMFRDLQEDEIDKLEKYICTRIVKQDQTGITVKRETPVRWALIWWRK